MVKVSDVIFFLDKLAPPQLAEKWDPIGLQIGDPNQVVQSVLLTLDITPAAINQAQACQAQLIISHHPLLFSPIKTIRADIPEQQMIMDIIRTNRSIYSAHTNLDAAIDGVGMALARALRLETTEEWQVVIPSEIAGTGHGRFNRLSTPMSLNQLRQVVGQQLGSSGCRINQDTDQVIANLAVFPGSFDEEWIEQIVRLDIDTIITGECKHHISLLLKNRGISLIETGHDVSERVILQPLSRRLEEEFVQISFAVHAGMDYNKMAF